MSLMPSWSLAALPDAPPGGLRSLCGCHGISLLTPVYVEYPHQCRHLLPLPVGLHGSWQADEAVIGGLGTCAEVPLAGEVNVLLCLHAFHASGKKETDEGQELFHRCFR